MKKFCPLCERDTEATFLKRYAARSRIFARRSILRCPQCSFLFIDPVPTPEELTAYYETDYLALMRTYQRSSLKNKAFRALWSKEIVQLLSHHIDFSRCGKFLDIGSGGGEIYCELKKRRLGGTAFYATELNSAQRADLNLRGITAAAHLDDITERDFDVTFVLLSLEHIPEPLEFMRAVKNKTKEGGFIFILVPQRDDMFKLIHEPHLSFFSLATLSLLTQKLGAKIVRGEEFGPRYADFSVWLNTRTYHLSLQLPALSGIMSLFKRAFGLTSEKEAASWCKQIRMQEEHRGGKWIRLLIQR